MPHSKRLILTCQQKNKEKKRKKKKTINFLFIYHFFNLCAPCIQQTFDLQDSVRPGKRHELPLWIKPQPLDSSTEGQSLLRGQEHGQGPRVEAVDEDKADPGCDHDYPWGDGLLGTVSTRPFEAVCDEDEGAEDQGKDQEEHVPGDAEGREIDGLVDVDRLECLDGIQRFFNSFAGLLELV